MNNLIEFDKQIRNTSSNHILAEWKDNNLYTYFIANQPVPFEWLIQIGKWVEKTQPIPTYKITKTFSFKPDYVSGFNKNHNKTYETSEYELKKEDIEEVWK